jgi:hypothetical protein
MAHLSSTGGAAVLGTSFLPTTTYLALFTTDPTYTGSGTEVTGGSPAYARQAVGTWSLSYSAGTETASNPSQIQFNVPTGTTVAYWGLFTASTGGNYLTGGSCTSQTFSAQGIYQFAVGAVTITAATAS